MFKNITSFAGYRKAIGFTLLEILIALFIFTIVSAILTKALHSIFSSQSVTRQHAERLEQLQRGLFILNRDIQQMVNRRVSDEAGNLQGFTGTLHKMSLVHGGFENPNNQLLRSTLQRTEYEFSEQTLWRITWNVLDLSGHAISTKRKLITDINEIEFAYSDDKGQFQSSWASSGNNPAPLPRAIQVSIDLKNLGKLTQLYVIPGANIEKSS